MDGRDTTLSVCFKSQKGQLSSIFMKNTETITVIMAQSQFGRDLQDVNPKIIQEELEPLLSSSIMFCPLWDQLDPSLIPLFSKINLSNEPVI